MPARREQTDTDARKQSNARYSSHSLDELVEYFDTHDLGEHLDQMPEVHCDVHIKRRTHLVAIDEKLAGRLTEIAKAKHVSSQALVNSWLEERFAQSGRRV